MNNKLRYRNLNFLAAEVKLTYLDKMYLVSMSVHQLAILLCFEKCDVVAKPYIEKETGLREETVNKNLAVLSDSGLLLKGDMVCNFYTRDTLS